MPFSENVASLAEITTVTASLSLMVSVCTAGVPKIAFTGALNVTTTVSLDSTSESSRIVTGIVADVLPAGIVIVPVGK